METVEIEVDERGFISFSHPDHGWRIGFHARDNAYGCIKFEADGVFVRENDEDRWFKAVTKK